MQGTNGFILPRNVRPQAYHLFIEPDMASFCFKGFERIELEILDQSSQIVLHAVGLDIISAFVHQSQHGIAQVSWRFDREHETLTLDFDHPLSPGKVELIIVFRGVLNDQLHGFYRSRYKLPDGTERFMATTQFEPVDARRAFPCFDEPSLKATFRLALIVPEDCIALSNMPIQEKDTFDQHDNSCEVLSSRRKKLVRFEETPRMPAHLFAYIVGDLESVEGKTKRGTQFRVWATPGKRHQCQFALEVGIRALEYLEDYFGIPYPLPKMDMVAIPDFAAGAMENWGLITYRERRLLLDPEKSSQATKQDVASVIAHELSHQWFGNLVTMEWWDDLWLNEGFASWMGDKTIAHLFPEWDTWTQFYIGDTERAFELDAMQSTHPVEVEVCNPREIGQIFDAISYSKGASLIRMLEQYLGEETFRQGLFSYLLHHSYGNARTEDLWDALSEVSGENVQDLMDPWTKQPGFPLVKVKEDYTGGDLLLKLSQSRFFYQKDVSRDSDKTLWTIPIEITTSAYLNPKHVQQALMKGRTKRVRVGNVSKIAWTKLNASQTGFYRVQYEPEAFKRFYPLIESFQLPTLDRLGLHGDLYAFSRALLIPVTEYLDCAAHFRNETEYSVWLDVSGGLSTVLRLLEDAPYIGALKGFVREIFVPPVKKLGWDKGPHDTDLDVLLRSLILGQLAYCGDQDTIEEARQRFKNYFLDQNSLDPNLRGFVCATVALYGDVETYENLLHLYRRSQLQEEKMCFLTALTRFQRPSLIQRTLIFTLSSEVRLQDALLVIAACAAHSNGRELTWRFVKKHWETLDERYGESKYMLGRCLEGIVSGFKTWRKKQDVVKFFETHPVPFATRSIVQSLERIDMNIAWLKKNRKAVAEWLQAKQK